MRQACGSPEELGSPQWGPCLSVRAAVTKRKDSRRVVVGAALPAGPQPTLTYRSLP